MQTFFEDALDKLDKEHFEQLLPCTNGRNKRSTIMTIYIDKAGIDEKAKLSFNCGCIIYSHLNFYKTRGYDDLDQRLQQEFKKISEFDFEIEPAYDDGRCLSFHPTSKKIHKLMEFFEKEKWITDWLTVWEIKKSLTENQDIMIRFESHAIEDHEFANYIMGFLKRLDKFF